MSRKPKFKPEIARVKLNPEQAVLVCSCYTGMAFVAVSLSPTRLVSGSAGCEMGSKQLKNVTPGGSGFCYSGPVSSITASS